MIKRCLLIIFSCISLFSNAQSKWDVQTLENINIGRNKNVDKSLDALSNSADYLAVGVPLSMLAIGYLNDNASLKREGYNAALSGLATYGVAFILKNTIDRERPYITNPQIDNYKEFSGKTFPSGTTASAFSTATTLSLSYPKWYVIAPAALYASTVGYSRLHLGAHYPTDVLAGAAFGIGSAFVSRKLNEIIRNESKRYRLKKYSN